MYVILPTVRLQKAGRTLILNAHDYAANIAAWVGWKLVGDTHGGAPESVQMIKNEVIISPAAIDTINPPAPQSLGELRKMASAAGVKFTPKTTADEIRASLANAGAANG